MNVLQCLGICGLKSVKQSTPVYVLVGVVPWKGVQYAI